MKPEQPVLRVIEMAAAHQAEVGDEFLILHTPGLFAMSAGVCFERDTADVLLLGSIILEPLVTCAENGTKDAIAGGRHPGSSRPETKAVTMCARLLS